MSLFKSKSFIFWFLLFFGIDFCGYCIWDSFILSFIWSQYPEEEIWSLINKVRLDSFLYTSWGYIINRLTWDNRTLNSNNNNLLKGLLRHQGWCKSKPSWWVTSEQKIDNSTNKSKTLTVLEQQPNKLVRSFQGWR